ncbi:MAG: hypothetical protein LBF85_03715 [Tannerella sp.]|jgi:hypothetical protein|nr:hypothetical protein [Tannerella sp.]
MIVTPDIFQGEIAIGQINHPDVIAGVQWFIDKYEPKYLRLMLGGKLYDELVAELSKEIPEEKWVKLAHRLRTPCAGYIYYYIRRDSASETAGAGEVLTEAENAIRRSPAKKMAFAWNEMVDRNRRFVGEKYAGAFESYAPSKGREYDSLFAYINPIFTGL